MLFRALCFILFGVISFLACPSAALAQEFMEIWPSGNIPNSKNLGLKDSIAHDRYQRVMLPGMMAYFPGKQENKGAAVLICPGGGYAWLAYIISGTQLAKWFNTMGITAFVLKYRLPHSPDLQQREIAPLMDAQRALRYIRAHADRWGIDPERVGVLGTSSGGHLAASMGTIHKDYAAVGDSLDLLAFRPDFMILVSPVIDMSTPWAHQGSVKNLLGPNAKQKLKEQFSLQLQVKAHTPTTFLVNAVNDAVVDPMNSALFYQALLRHQVPVSFHSFSQGGHSIALRNNPGPTQLWTELCERWMMASGIIPETLPPK